ncbi:HlyD family secretion protein [Rhizobium terrae]|uniref:hypothetical protein n=1 Tax=Rhizobium terrae TaxID=2171756 RepID=UPI000E3DFCB4|nr:hypothetical protein [Rhizobium terrae]
MKLIKILVGIILIIAALYVIVGEQLTGASADAVINARVTTTRAPIAGNLDLSQKPLGARISAGEPLGSINDPLVDSMRLNDLVNERAQTDAEAKRLRTNLDSVNGSIELLRTRSKNYSQERIRQLQAQVTASESLAAAAEARLRAANQALSRSTSLSARGAETGISFERAQSLAEVSQLELENAKVQEQ